MYQFFLPRQHYPVGLYNRRGLYSELGTEVLCIIWMNVSSQSFGCNVKFIVRYIVRVYIKLRPRSLVKSYICRYVILFAAFRNQYWPKRNIRNQNLI